MPSLAPREVAPWLPIPFPLWGFRAFLSLDPVAYRALHFVTHAALLTTALLPMG